MNPYEKWLGLAAENRKPDYFELLGIATDEDDAEFIKTAALLQIRKLKPYRSGPHAETCEKLVKQICKAHSVLTTPQLREQYEAQLSKQMASEATNHPPISATNEPTVQTKVHQDVLVPLETPSTSNEKTWLILLLVGGSIFALAATAAIVLIGWWGYWYFGNQAEATYVASQPAPHAEQEAEDVQAANPKAAKTADVDVAIAVPTKIAVPTDPAADKPRRTVTDPSPVLHRSIQWHEEVAKDLKLLPQSERQFTRYFSFTHLRATDLPPNQQANYPVALAKLLNSLSWNSKLVIPRPLKTLPGVYRVDLRDLNWDTTKWDTILLDYPHGYWTDVEVARTIREETSTEFALIRGDWFIAAASRPPLYHDLLEIPENVRDLERRIGVDVKAGVVKNQTRRIGISKSAVAKSNRILEQHSSLFGTYWKTYDFENPEDTESKTAANRTDIFKHPFDSKSGGNDSFEHSSHQVLFELPNGLLGFMQTSDLGRRIEKSDIDTVFDLSQTDHAMLTGQSCFSCHFAGPIVAKDEIRSHFLSQSPKHKRHEELLSLYLADSADAFTESNQIYHDKISVLGAAAESRQQEPISLAVQNYNSDVTLKIAAKELGIPIEKLRSGITNLYFEKVKQPLTELLVNKKVARPEFDDHFAFLVEELKLGFPSMALGSVKGKSRASARRRAFREIAVPHYHQRLAATREGLAKGKFQRQQGDLAAAQEQFQLAIKSAPDDESRLEPLEQLAELFQVKQDAEGLITTFRQILDQTPIHGDSPRLAHDHFYRSVLRLTVEKLKIKKDDYRVRDALKVDPDSWFRWPDIGLPESTIDTIERALGPALEQNPNHKPLLMAMDTFYSRFRKNPVRLKEILTRIQDNPSFEKHTSYLDSRLARAKMDSGEFEEAARLFETIRKSDNDVSAYELYQEANAWMLAKNFEKALPAMVAAEQGLPKDGSYGVFLERIGDAYIKLGQHDKAVKTFSNLLESKSILINVPKLQAKLKTALAGMKDAPTNDKMTALLDEGLAFREKAEMFEKSNSKNKGMEVHYLIPAAQNWAKGNRPEKALDAANRATEALHADFKNRNKSHHSRELAKVYVAIGAKQRAFDTYVFALKHAKYSNEIKSFQKKLAELEQDPNVSASEDLTALMSPDFQYVSQAKQAESKQTHNDLALSGTLLKASSYWLSSKDTTEIVRCGRKLMAAVDRASIPIGGQPGITLDQAYLYQGIVAYSKRLDEFVSTTNSTNDDLKAYQASIAEASSKAAKQLAGIDAGMKEKLDPRFKTRQRAEAEEAEAALEAEKRPYQAIRLYLQAKQSWVFSQDKERELLAVQKAEEVLHQIPKTDGAFARYCISVSNGYSTVHMYSKSKTQTLSKSQLEAQAKTQAKSRELYRLGYENEQNSARKAKHKAMLDRFKRSDEIKKQNQLRKENARKKASAEESSAEE